MPLDVICPNCHECYFETNDEDGIVETPRDILLRNYKKEHIAGLSWRKLSDYVRKYDPNAPANAAMIRLKLEFIGVREDIQHDRNLRGDAIEPCPGCWQWLSESHKFITRPQADDPDRLTCKYCNRPPFKTVQGRATHEIQWCKLNPAHPAAA